MTVPTSDDLVARLKKLETGIVSDVLDEAGLPQHLVSSTIGPLPGSKPFAGRAVTARGRRLIQGADKTAGSPVDRIEELLHPAAVVMIDTGSFVGGACLGGFVAAEFKRRGCQGIVVDGAIRDADEIAELGLPVHMQAVTPANGSRRWGLTDTNETISLPGQDGAPLPISPGDYVLADSDGVVVIPQLHIVQIIEDSEKLLEIEAAIRTAMEAGSSRAEAFKQNPRFRHIRKVS